MKPKTKPGRTAEQQAEEEAVRRQHAANPVRQRPAGAINRQSFAAILSLLARFKATRESQRLERLSGQCSGTGIPQEAK
jgi:hypothetical protein